MQEAHESVFGAHLGAEKTIDRIQKRYYWPAMKNEITNHCKTCLICQEHKTPTINVTPPMQIIRSYRPFQLITADLMGPLPTTKKRNVHILVVVDHFTKWVEIRALKTKEATETAQELYKIICRHGVPEAILTDQGTNFQATLLKELWDLFDVHSQRTTPYHPQCDGLTERFNRTMRAMIAAYIEEGQLNCWDEHLDALQLAYNTATHKTTGYSPFELIYGRQPRLPLDIFDPNIQIDLSLDTTSYANSVKLTLEAAFRCVSNITDISMNKNKIRFDRHTRAAKYDIGDLVWYKDERPKAPKTKKLIPRWTGPYRITDKFGESVYKMKHTLITSKTRKSGTF